MKFANSILFIMATISVSTGLAEWDCAATAGVFIRSTDCTVSIEIVVTGKLNVTGVPDAQGNLPKIIGGGSNRLFNVDDGELVVEYLNLTGGYGQITGHGFGAARAGIPKG